VNTTGMKTSFLLQTRLITDY